MEVCENQIAGGVAREGPAALAIRLLGAKRIAHRCDLTTDAVWKWPKRAAGTIPAEHQATIFELARELGKPLTAGQIIGLSDTASETVSAEAQP